MSRAFQSRPTRRMCCPRYEWVSSLNSQPVTPARTALPLSFRSCVPFREIRLRDLDGVSDFFGVAGTAFGCGSAGCSLAAGTVAGQGDDCGVQRGERAVGAVAAVRAAGLGGDVGADEAQDGGEGMMARVGAGGRRRRGRPRRRSCCGRAAAPRLPGGPESGERPRRARPVPRTVLFR